METNRTSSPSVSSCDVIVIGGGLGGLALAQGLTAAKIATTVFERDAAPTGRPQGYRISINATGYAALRELLPADRFHRLSSIETRDVGREFYFASASLAPLMFFPSSDGVGAMTVSRPRLRALLCEGLDIRWQKRLTAFRDDDRGVVAEFDDGSSVRAKLLIGCDGAGSDVREQMRRAGAPNIPELVSTHLASVGATIDRTPDWEAALPLNRFGAVQYLGPRGCSLFVSYCEGEDGRRLILWALTQRDRTQRLDEKSWKDLARSPEGRAQLHKGCVDLIDHDGWHPHLRRLVRETPHDKVIDPMIIKKAQMPKKMSAHMWPSARVTLLGDAAHAMPPQRGIGGNQAFEDARSLASVLTRARLESSTGLADAIEAYESEMLARGRRAVDESDETANLCHISNPIAQVARNTILRVVNAVSRRRHVAHATPTTTAGESAYPRGGNRALDLSPHGDAAARAQVTRSE